MATMLRNLSAVLFIALQSILPARLLGRVVHALTRSRLRPLKNLLIRNFVRLYRVDTTEAALPVPQGYESFNAFFTRALQPDARPLAADPLAVISPADGTIQQLGAISGHEILQVKGITYDVHELLAGDEKEARYYDNGSFVTIYLAPWNYHRVHMPVAGRVVSMRHAPGALWSVNQLTTERVPRLFARNERLVCLCEADWGRFAVVLVGALNVGSISTAWAGEVLPRRSREVTTWHYTSADPATWLNRGDLLGQFNMGSTVIALFPAGRVRWRDDLAPHDPLRVGAALGSLQMGIRTA